jgi:YidC/Oxa1 family membrane protein insertase
MSSLLAGPIGLAYHVVIVLTHVLSPLGANLATVAAIVAFTIGVRLLLAPLTFYGMRGQTRITAVQPRVRDLQTRYARQPDRLQAELSALYAQEAGGMLAGCLPLLLQLPFFSVMYRLFLSGTIGGRPNVLLHRQLLGTPLGTHLLSSAGLLSPHVLVFIGLLGLLALVAALSARTVQASTGPASTGRASTGRAGAPAAPPPASGALGVMTRVLPYATLIIAAFVPLAAGIYLLTTTAWTVAERRLLRTRARPASPPASAASPVRCQPPRPGTARSRR